MNKAREICDKTARCIPYVMILSYILDKGQSMISQITDEDIDKIKDNGFMTADFQKGIVRAAREVVKNCDQSDIVRLFKSDWCCAGEVYNKELDQYVSDVKQEDDWDED